MFQLNNEIVLLKNELNLLKGESAEQIAASGNELNQKLHRRWVMISSEGAVFIGLLLLGIYQIRKTFKKEKELANQQKNFLLSVTHELKSPIASTRLQIETLLLRDLDKEKQKEILNNAIHDTDRLNNLVENILLASKIENDFYKLHLEKCNLSEYLTENLNQTIRIFNYAQKIILDIEPKIHLNIDKTAFPSIIINLLENAVKYSPKESTITIKLNKDNNQIKLAVLDEGVGISDEEKINIFQKFYRIGNEETRSAKGTGLGLYIVQFLVEKHNGTISIKNNSPKGSIFEVVFN
jgi:K+-sensing histidine kinase KdpD